MASEHARRRKAEAKRKRKRETKKRDDRLRRAAETVDVLARRAAKWPLHECVVATGWQERHLAEILIARKHPAGGYAYALLVLDTGCLGSKDAQFLYDATDEEYRELRDQLGHPHALEPLDPAHARKIADTAVAYAERLGFPRHPDHELALALLGDADPATCSEIVPVGDGHGRPLYRAEPGDDVEVILAHLRERVGERGYRFVAAEED